MLRLTYGLLSVGVIADEARELRVGDGSRVSAERVQLDATDWAFLRVVLVGFHAKRARDPDHPDVRFDLHLV
jgi:hypothetical protein